MSLPDTNRLIQLGKWLFRLNAAIWLAFVIWSNQQYGYVEVGTAITLFVIAVLMVGNVAAFLWCSWAIQKQASWYRFAIIAILSVNIILTFTDQFGIFDLLTLLLDIFLLGVMLILLRRRSNQWL